MPMMEALTVVRPAVVEAVDAMAAKTSTAADNKLKQAT